MKSEKFVEIKVVEQVRSAVEMAVRFRFPVLIIGDPGLGKSTALRRIATEKDAAYCEVSQHTKTVKGLYQTVLDAFGIRVDRSFVLDLYRTCAERLSTMGSDGLLFMDEYQNLPAATLRELLHLQEKTGIVLVLAGNTERLSRTNATAGALDQIESRIGLRIRVDRPTPHDCMQIGIEFNVEGKEAYAALSAFGERKTVRDLVRLLELCAENTGGRGSIKLPELKEAAQLLFGRGEAVKLFNIHSNA